MANFHRGGSDSPSIVEIIDSLIRGHYHLWYVYLIIGFYLILPLLRLWVKKENKKYIEYYIILALLFTFLIPQIINVGSIYFSIFESFDEVIKNLNLQYIGGYTVYFILGWYLNNFKIKREKIVYSLGFISIILSIFGTYILSIKSGEATQMFGNLTVNVFFQALCIYIFIKDKVEKNKIKTNKAILLISKNSLGIYAIHVMIATIAYLVIKKISFDVAIINIPIVFVITLIISFIITIILNKIPLLRRVV